MKPECLKCKHYYVSNTVAYSVQSCSSPKVITTYFDQVNGMVSNNISCKEARNNQCKDGIHFEPKKSMLERWKFKILSLVK